MGTSVGFSGQRKVPTHITFSGNYASELQTKLHHRKEKMFADCLYIWMLN